MTITTKNLTSLTATTFFAVLLGLSFGNQDAYAQSFPDFSDLTGLTLNNDAAQVNANVLRLAEAVTGESGSAFFDSTVGIEQFKTQFEFRLSALAGSDGFDAGADGIVFTIQNDAAADAAFGAGGGSLGYVGISDSVGVSFDHWINAFDTQENISIHSGGTITKLAEAGFEFDPDTTYTVWIDYDGTTLEVFISTTNVKPGLPTLSHAIDIPATVGSSDAYVGFTASTGAAVGNHDILSWNFNSSQTVCNDDAGLEDSICKSVLIEDDSGNGIIAIDEPITYTFVIDVINNDSETWLVPIITDDWPGDLAVGDEGADLTNWDHTQFDFINFANNLANCDLDQTGQKNNNEHLTCEVAGDGDLDVDETASVGVTAQTDWNFGQSKKFMRGQGGIGEYTSCGVHSINPGATISYFLAADDQAVVDPRTLSTPELFVTVYQNSNLSLSDCDGDGVFDNLDLCPFRGLEETGFIDSDGCPFDPV